MFGICVFFSAYLLNFFNKTTFFSKEYFFFKNLSKKKNYIEIKYKKMEIIYIV